MKIKKILIRFGYFINTIASYLTTASKFQLIFFNFFILLAICLLLITSTLYTVSNFSYVYVLVYGSLMTISLLYRSFIFSIDYLKRSAEMITLWRLRKDKNREIITPQKIIDYNNWIQHFTPQTTGQKIIKLLFWINDNINVFGIVLLLCIIGGLLASTDENIIMINSVGVSYLFCGWSMIILYFILSMIVDFTFEIISIKKYSHVISWWSVINKFLPCGFVYSFFNHFFINKLKNEKRKLLLRIISFGILVTLNAVFFFCLTMITHDSRSGNAYMFAYWFIFGISFVSGIFQSIRYLKSKKEQCYHLISESSEEDLLDPNNNTETYEMTEGTYLRMQLRNENDENETTEMSTFDLLNKLRKQMFGFEYQRSTILIVFCSVGFVVILIIGIVMGKYLKSQSLDNELPIDEDQYVSFRNYLSSFSFNKNDQNNNRKVNNQNENNNFYYQMKNKQDTIQRSHICSKDVSGISPMEYIYLSYMTYYLGENSTVYGFFDKQLKNNHWNYSLELESNHLHYLKGYNDKLKLKIIAFRGTYTLEDCVHDLQLFLESATPSISLGIFPVFTRDTLSMISTILSFFGSNAFPKGSLYLANLAETVVKRELDEDIPVVLTGHSLGGGIANIIASKLGLVSYAISPPGIALGKDVYDFTKEDLMMGIRSLLPERDPVATLGENGGQSITIPCYEDSLGCHSLDTTVCQVAQLCHMSDLLPFCVERWERWKINYNEW